MLWLQLPKQNWGHFILLQRNVYKRRIGGTLYRCKGMCIHPYHPQKMGHKQPLTPVQTDNSTAKAVTNSKIQPKQTKAMDMWFHWLRDRETLKQFCFYWRSGNLNLANHFTKHYPTKTHQAMWGELLTAQRALDEFRRRKTRKATYAAYLKSKNTM